MATATFRDSAPSGFWNIRPDQLTAAGMVPPNSRVLEIGCSEGSLLAYLRDAKHGRCQGLELSLDGVRGSLAKGLAVVQGDADTDLAHFPDKAFDVVILSQTLQTTKRPKEVLRQMLRIGNEAVVSFTNFGYWRHAIGLAWRARMPVNRLLPSSWHGTENIHMFTLLDFEDLCENLGGEIAEFTLLSARGGRRWLPLPDRLRCWLSAQAIYRIKGP